jgi:hypothetical protein
MFGISSSGALDWVGILIFSIALVGGVLLAWWLAGKLDAWINERYERYVEESDS